MDLARWRHPSPQAAAAGWKARTLPGVPGSPAGTVEVACLLSRCWTLGPAQGLCTCHLRASPWLPTVLGAGHGACFVPHPRPIAPEERALGRFRPLLCPQPAVSPGRYCRR